jgi:acetoin utilization deacetylase AcuC-like enzyme
MFDVYFSPQMVGPPQRSSPSAHKPAAVVESWLRLIPDLRVIAPQPVDLNEIALAHDADWAADILTGRADNGFGNRSLEIAATLPYTSGAMLAAALAADRHGMGIAPCSGFHHAGWASAVDYCTFNGLMITSRVLLQCGSATRVGILDADMHYGNGTDEIISMLGETRVQHHSVGEHFHHPADAVRFLAELPGLVDTFAGCDVLLYQAGADPHIDDPLGGWLTTEELFRRDYAVFLQCRRRGIPVAWNLAGGYQSPLRKILDVHDNTLRAAKIVWSRVQV